MPSVSSVRVLLRLLLALLLAVNGIAPALAAGVMHQAAPAAADTHAMAMSVDAADCHAAAAVPDAPMADETPAPCCEDGRCDNTGCDCACMALAAALPMPDALAWAATLRAAPLRAVAQAHAPPPPTGVTRPPIA